MTPPLLPGTTGHFIQMFPTCPGGSIGDSNGNCPTAPPATSPTNTPPLQPKPKQFTSLAEGGGLPGGTTTNTGGTTSTSGFHVDADGVLTKDANPDGSCGPGTEHRFGANPKQCFVLVVEANTDGICMTGWSHFPGADPKQCFLNTAIQTGNSGGTEQLPVQAVLHLPQCRHQ